MEEKIIWAEKVRIIVFKEHCIVCGLTFSIACGGLTDLKPHASSGGHKRPLRDTTTQGTLDQFVVHQSTPEADGT